MVIRDGDGDDEREKNCVCVHSPGLGHGISIFMVKFMSTHFTTEFFHHLSMQNNISYQGGL